MKISYKHPTILIIGPEGPDKQALVKDYFKNQHDIPRGIVCTPHDHQVCRDGIPDNYYYIDYEPEILRRFIKRQKDIIRLSAVDLRGLLFLNGCLDSVPEWWNDRDIRWVICNNRLIKLTCLLTLSSCALIPEELIANIDYIFIHDEPNIIIQKQFCDIFPNFDTFSTTLNTITKNHGWMVINRSQGSNHLEDIVYQYHTVE